MSNIPSPFLASAAAIVLAAAVAAGAAPLSQNPGASLVIPYFEVDLDQPDGRSTLIALGNVGEPVIAHVTIWTDWGLPVYAWDVHLGKDAIETFNLRDLVAYGNLPASGSPAPLPGCASPVYRPPLPLATVVQLQKQLTGQPVEGESSCYSQPRLDPSLATGSITVDALEQCTAATPWPIFPIGELDPFFEPGKASAREVLWGDFTLVDPSENFAEGFEA